MPASKLNRRRVARVHEPGSGPDKSDQLLRYQRALRELERDGHVSDPGLAARIRAGWHPGVEMAVMTTDPELPPFIKAACYKTLLDYVEAPKAAQLKLGRERRPWRYQHRHPDSPVGSRARLAISAGATRARASQP